MITKTFTTDALGAGGPGVPAGQVRVDHHQLQAQREEQEGQMVGHLIFLSTTRLFGSLISKMIKIMLLAMFSGT